MFSGGATPQGRQRLSTLILLGGAVQTHSSPYEMWAEGGAPKLSWASPWYVLTVKDATITDRLGRLTAETTDEIATAVARLVGVDSS
jgi:hypothetical protein